MDTTATLEFDLTQDEPKIIKVIGVGGGGGNAVTHMYRKGIHDVSFLLCNTDKQALASSDVPNKLVLGETITKGLGAGNRPEIARRAAQDSEEDIRKNLSDGTSMVFVTAGMGGGTGTGAAPVVARIAKEMDILTVGIVTIPFKFEGERKIMQAIKGVEEIRSNVDALLIINNERLREIYPDFTIMTAFARADDTLSTAAKSIAEIITIPGLINLDFADVNTTMKDGGVALISNGYGEGDRRVEEAINDALNSPLLNNNDIFTARKILFNIYFDETSELRVEEMNYVNKFMADFNKNIEVIWGTSIDNNLGKQIKITILATGFGLDSIPELVDTEMQNEIGKYYPENENDRGGKRRDYIDRIAILTDNELDDDSFISLLEDNPPYRRDPRLIADFRAKNKPIPATPSPAVTNNGTDLILF
ncbi:MAG: cell division protein FtsZ [Tannerellaceae bacterium]|jgi:cell division protein FtsZ|nr:cell division protein FtsZ [Tannerellaceae bacterium]